MAKVTLKSALLNYGNYRRSSLTDADRAHLKRWSNEASDPIWKKIGGAMEKYHNDDLSDFMSRNIVDYPYSVLIGDALRARRAKVESPKDVELEAKLQYEQEIQRRAEIRHFAHQMIEVADKFEKFSPPKKAPPPPDYPPPKPTVAETEKEFALDWIRKQAQKLMEFAEEAQCSDFGPPDGWDTIKDLRGSRQSGGNGKRNRSRDIRHFVQLMVNTMYRHCGKPNYQAVAAMTNIAFPHATLTAEDARSFCRPTRRKERRGKSGT